MERSKEAEICHILQLKIIGELRCISRLNGKADHIFDY